mmetsp:Transcript_116646/g.212164  ORF Transcript_116646/g.212164 Transcript_116646/m.212164 type:complete len:614 (+) Transcript_116646:88-1929(+)
MSKIAIILACIACLGHGRRVQTSIAQEVNAAFTPSAPGTRLPAGSRGLNSRVPSAKTAPIAVDDPAAGARVPPTGMASAVLERPAVRIPVHQKSELKRDADVGSLEGQGKAASATPTTDTHMAPLKEETKSSWNQTRTLVLASVVFFAIITVALVRRDKVAAAWLCFTSRISMGLAVTFGIVGQFFGKQATRGNFTDDSEAAPAAPAKGWRPTLTVHSRVGAPVMQAPAVEAESRFIVDNPGNNVPPHIAALVGRNLHLKGAHPLGIIKNKIAEYFNSLEGGGFDMVDDLDPLVKAEQCFDDLLIPTDHPGRAPSDTYYVTRDGGIETASAEDTLLRTHTSAHQSALMKDGRERFLCTGDVYRRDEIDRSHFPAFHQMEGVKLFDPEVVGGAMTKEEWLASPGCKLIADDLKKTLEGMCDVLFGPVEKRWIDEYFPFTEPSFELEIFYNGDWMEVLGCGVIHSGVLEKVGKSDRHGWAFGLGLERLAMVLFQIPDIRLFWSEDERFTEQFKEGEITTFKEFSKYSPVFKDIAMWIPEGYTANDFYELARGVCGDLVEKIDLIDEFTNPKKGKTSHCYRITYRSMERTLTNEEIDKLQFDLRAQVEEELKVELR